MKVCLIRCPSPFLINDRLFPPLGLMAVGTALKERGHDVTIYDGFICNLPAREFEYYGFGPTTPEYFYAKLMRDIIREYNPKAKIVIGGAHATLNPDMCMDEGWDCTVVGDGEMMAERAFLNDRPTQIARERNLDDYSIPDRGLIDMGKYKYSLNGIPATTMVTSKGCPYHCAFCCKNHGKVRMRSAEKVSEEIRYLYNLGYKAIAFPDDIFILDRRRTEKVFRTLMAFGISWRCLVRADLLLKYGTDFTESMARSGCIEVGMGIESGSEKILKTINKGEKVETIKEAIWMLKSSGIRVKGFFIVGLPGESNETLNETRRFLDEMKLDDIDVKIYQPFPFSPIWENRTKYDIQWDAQDLKDMFYKGRPGEYRGSVRTAALTNDEIVSAWIDMEAKYKRYASP